ncbi:S-methyl-5-thioribose-1-phosphate isomerase [Spongorhabdus nitratireducens]
MSQSSLPLSIIWQDNRTLSLLDQTLLPLELRYEEQQNIEQVWDSIKQLKVRGAPAIGIAGAYGLVIGMQDNVELSTAEFLAELRKQADYLNSARPTAVNLSWALERVVNKAGQSDADTAEALLSIIRHEAELIHEEDRQLCRGIGEHGLPLIKEGMGVLTHCNAGGLAVSERGTALSPLYLAHEQNISFKVYADETRPLLQGARLTAWELSQAGIDVTLQTDNMAAYAMQQGLIDLVIVGTDRVAANGDVANKIGTLGVAILAKHYNIPFYVASPSSTIDLSTKTGADIEIEQRHAEEVCEFGARRTAPENISVLNPAFDVTPAELVTGIITEKGILHPPFAEGLQQAAS